MSNLCDNAVSSEDESDYESEKEDDNADCEGDDEHGELVRILSDVCIARCDKDNGRKECSGFDITCRRYLGHFFSWMGKHKRKHGKYIVECHSKNIH